ncbi:MAG: hypothetical protein JWM02_728 [Frankiales bacterium]|nr:hypothetical protein [Frankiales bacterium]
MLTQPFMQHALLAGTPIALAAGLVGWFLVLRAQVFTADALSHVAFTGALAALAVGIDPRLGLFAITIAVGLALSGLGPRGQPDDTIIGGVFAWVLGLGVLFLSIYTSGSSGGNGTAAVAVLFGSVLGLSHDRALVAALIAVVCFLAMLALARPLLMASIDPRVAAARRLPVRLLGAAFLGVVATTAAEASQVVGALLILGLVTAPAATASRLSTHPYRAMALSCALAVGATWAGLFLSFYLPSTPPSFAILAVATAAFILTFAPWRHHAVLALVHGRRSEA